MCRAELGQLRKVQAELVKRGGTILGISADDVEHTKRMAEAVGRPFPLLADPELSVIREFGLFHGGAGPGGVDAAVPAHVLVAPSGRVAWRYVSRKVQDRPAPGDDLAAVRALGTGD